LDLAVANVESARQLGLMLGVTLLDTSAKDTYHAYRIGSNDPAEGIIANCAQVVLRTTPLTGDWGLQSSRRSCLLGREI